MNNRFLVELSSDLDYEEMVVDVSLDMEPFAILSCEKGLDNIEIELTQEDADLTEPVPFEDYMHAIEFAEKVLRRTYYKID